MSIVRIFLFQAGVCGRRSRFNFMREAQIWYTRATDQRSPDGQSITIAQATPNTAARSEICIEMPLCVSSEIAVLRDRHGGSQASAPRSRAAFEFMKRDCKV